MDARAKAVVRNALAIYLAWVAATYLLEGLPGTLVRPEAVGLRLAYALIANLGLGILVPLWFLRGLARSGWAAAEDFGFSGPDRTFVSVSAAAAIGAALFAFSQSEPVHWIVFLNSFAQVWVVSVAEIVTCWALVGATVFVALRRWSRAGAYGVAAVVASVLFGVYHFAHSAPFNAPGMVLFLTGIGFVTSVWWFVSRDVYGTAIFHNFFAVTGVLAALKAGGLVPEHPEVALLLLVIASVALLAVAIPGWTWIRRYSARAL
jgi:hypothetical protein